MNYTHSNTPPHIRDREAALEISDTVTRAGSSNEENTYNDEHEQEHDFEDEDNNNTSDLDTEGWEENLMEGLGDEENEEIRRRLQIRLLQLIQDGRNFRTAHGSNSYNDDNVNSQDCLFWDGSLRRIHNSRAHDLDRFPKVPSMKGAELMDSGNFGFCKADVLNLRRKHTGKKINLTMKIFNRELAIENPARQRINQMLMAQEMIPSSNADMIIQFKNPVYSGQFSNDGNFFFAANKDFKVRMYDTSNPYDWRYYKTVSYPSGKWTLTDASLSPDNKYLAYTSIQSNVCLAPTDPNDTGDPYILDLAGSRGATWGSSFGIWSIRYSGDGQQLVAGTTDGSIVVYAIESRTQLHQINGHDEDVNAVCLADSSSPHILFSGSDDKTLKVWDTRSMGDSRAAGTFIGHIEGLTYIDSKGDGRYILSNGKDQSAKLWDIRMVISPQKYENIKRTRRVGRSYFDYRFGDYDEDYWYEDPHDCSLVTFRGHKVLRTLIRCHFSPHGSTNSRYIYSGSQDGKIYIWNLDATLAGIIDVYQANLDALSAKSNDLESPFATNEVDIWNTCVRDASWHPIAPMIVASAWNEYNRTSPASGICTIHSWNNGTNDDEAEPKMGLRVDHKLTKS